MKNVIKLFGEKNKNLGSNNNKKIKYLNEDVYEIIEKKERKTDIFVEIGKLKDNLKSLKNELKNKENLIGKIEDTHERDLKVVESLVNRIKILQSKLELLECENKNLRIGTPPETVLSKNYWDYLEKEFYERVRAMKKRSQNNVKKLKVVS